MEKDNREVVIYANIIKLISFFVLSLALTLLGMLETLVGLKVNFGFADITIKDGYSYAFVTLIGIACTVIFLPSTVFYVRKIIKWEPSLIINETGIFDNTSYTSIGYVSWDEVKGICFYEISYKAGSQLVLGIELNNRDEIINKFRGLKKFLIKQGKYPVNIPQNLINIDISEVYKIIKGYIT